MDAHPDTWPLAQQVHYWKSLHADEVRKKRTGHDVLQQKLEAAQTQIAGYQAVVTEYGIPADEFIESARLFNEVVAERDALQAENSHMHEKLAKVYVEVNDIILERNEAQAENARLTEINLEMFGNAVDLLNERDRVARQVTDLTEGIGRVHGAVRAAIIGASLADPAHPNPDAVLRLILDELDVLADASPSEDQ